MRSTRTRTRFASSSESGLFSGDSGTNESTARSVSLSINTCLMNFSAEKQSTGSSSPQEACGNFARICSQYLPAELRQAPAGSTHMGLHVEDELLAVQRVCGRRGLEC